MFDVVFYIKKAQKTLFNAPLVKIIVSGKLKNMNLKI